MAELLSWGITTEAGDEIELSVATFPDEDDLVRLEVRPPFSEATSLLSQKEARELARDLNRAAANVVKVKK